MVVAMAMVGVCDGSFDTPETRVSDFWCVALDVVKCKSYDY